MKVRFFLVLTLLLAVSVTGIFYGCAPGLDGSTPRFTIGDQWVYRWATAMGDYTVTMEITGEEQVNGDDCWVMETIFDPMYMGVITGMTTKYEKTDLDIVFTDYHNIDSEEFTTITYEISGTPYYPLVVGKESTEIEVQIISTGDPMITQTENVTVTSRTVVEKIEKITVEAGTFDCFKVLKYDGNGNLTQISWRSDKIKLLQVKMTDMEEEDAVYELISYSMKD